MIGTEIEQNIETIREIIRAIIPTLQKEAGEKPAKDGFSYTQQRAMINQIFKMTSEDNYNVASIMLRLTVIDSLYSTNAQYSYFSIEDMAKRIYMSLNKSEEEAADYFYSLVTEKNKKDKKKLFSSTYGIRKNCEDGSQQMSLMSKYAYYVLIQNPVKYPLGFPIYDSLAIQMYPRVCEKIGIDSISKSTISQTIENYIMALDKVRATLFAEGDFEGYQQYDLLDAYLWRMGKVNNGNYSLLLTRGEYKQFVKNLRINNIRNKEDSYNFNAIVKYQCATLPTDNILKDIKDCECIKQLIDHWKGFYLLKIREATQKDSSEITKIIQLERPTESMFISTGLTKGEFDLKLDELVKSTKTLYRKTFIAEYAGKIIGAIWSFDGAKYLKLKLPIEEVVVHELKKWGFE